MHSEEFRKVKTKVPFDLWNEVEALGFESANGAVINAFERLVSDQELNDFAKEQENRIQELKSELENEQRQILELQIKIKETETIFEDEQRFNQELKSKIQEFEKQLGNEQKQNQELHNRNKETEKRLEVEQRNTQELQSKLKEADNKLLNDQMHIQEIQKELEIRMEEAKKQIKDLQKELEKTERREIYFEEMHNNYMMQVQTLINQKQIIAPGVKKPWWRIW
jgi:chromosome segregation ATPase